MDSPCIKQTVCKVLKIFQYGKYLVAYVLNITFSVNESSLMSIFDSVLSILVPKVDNVLTLVVFWILLASDCSCASWVNFESASALFCSSLR